MKRALSFGMFLSAAPAFIGGTPSASACSPYRITGPVTWPNWPVVRPASLTGALEEASPVTLHITLYNRAGLSSAEIERMTRTVSYILDLAGIKITTVLCPQRLEGSASPAECGTAPGPAEMALEVLRSPPRELARHRLGSILGSTRVNEAGTMSSQVYYIEALQLAAQSGLVETPKLLGYALAHEIGHALLATDGHSASGVMRAVFGQAELREMAWGRLRFSPSEACLLRENLRARASRSITTE